MHDKTFSPQGMVWCTPYACMIFECLKELLTGDKLVGGSFFVYSHRGKHTGYIVGKQIWGNRYGGEDH